MELAAYRDTFPITQRYAFLDHATGAPLGNHVTRAIQAHIERALAAPPSQVRDALAETAERIKQRAAALIHAARADEIAIVPNAVIGLNTAANSLPLQPGTTVLVLDGEDPAHVYPWMNLAARGILVKRIAQSDGGLDLEQLDRWIDSRTRVLALSSALPATGFRHDLAALGAAARQRGLFFVVDASQTLGAFPVDVQAYQIDFLVADAGRWLLGIPGAALLYCRHDLLDRLQPGAYVGATSTLPPINVRDYGFTLHTSSERFTIGESGDLAIAGLAAALELILEIGEAPIAERILDLTDILIGDLRERGHTLRTHAAPRHRSGIIVLEHPTPQAAYDRLLAAGIVATRRPSGLCLAPHFYNSEEDVLRVGSALSKHR